MAFRKVETTSLATKKERINPTRKCGAYEVCCISRSADFSRSNIVAARMMGMARKNENLIDSCKLSLVNNPPRVDINARLVPGIMEIA